MHYVALYANFRKETATQMIFDHLRKKGIHVVYPKINMQKKILDFFEVESLASMHPGRYVHLEPNDQASPIPLERIDLVVVPGIVFDREGYRLGYGKGYYDRFLKISRAKSVGLTFGFQRVEKIPHDDHDQSVDVVITEKEIEEL